MGIMVLGHATKNINDSWELRDQVNQKLTVLFLNKNFLMLPDIKDKQNTVASPYHPPF